MLPSFSRLTMSEIFSLQHIIAHVLDVASNLGREPGSKSIKLNQSTEQLHLMYAASETLILACQLSH